MSSGQQRIKVGVRIRPGPQGSSSECVIANEGGIVSIDRSDGSSRGPKEFCFDWAFDQKADQWAVYQSMVQPLITALFSGYNATFFAYGQTGSGKTHTMGTGSAKLTDGILPYAVRDLMADRAKLVARGHRVTIALSFLEIYNEECYDLLNGATGASAKTAESAAPLLSSDNGSINVSRTRVELRELPCGEVTADGLTHVAIQSEDDVATCLNYALRNRSTGSTAMNSQSSRSHAICSFHLTILDPKSATNSSSGGALHSRLHLVDLAGSERMKKTLASGSTLREGININKGLLALGNVIAALNLRHDLRSTAAAGNGGQGSNHVHVPFRGSKLTRLLKSSLGGNAFTVLLACVSPLSGNLDESTNSLAFATRAASVVNSASVNRSTAPGEASLLREIARLRSQMAVLREQNDALVAMTAAAAASVAGDHTAAAAVASAPTEVLELARGQVMESEALYAIREALAALTTLVTHVFFTDEAAGGVILFDVEAEVANLRVRLGFEPFSVELLQDRVLLYSTTSPVLVRYLEANDGQLPFALVLLDNVRETEIMVNRLLTAEEEAIFDYNSEETARDAANDRSTLFEDSLMDVSHGDLSMTDLRRLSASRMSLDGVTNPRILDLANEAQSFWLIPLLERWEKEVFARETLNTTVVTAIESDRKVAALKGRIAHEVEERQALQTILSEMRSSGKNDAAIATIDRQVRLKFKTIMDLQLQLSEIAPAHQRRQLRSERLSISSQPVDSLSIESLAVDGNVPSPFDNLTHPVDLKAWLQQVWLLYLEQNSQRSYWEARASEATARCKELEEQLTSNALQPTKVATPLVASPPAPLMQRQQAGFHSPAMKSRLQTAAWNDIPSSDDESSNNTNVGSGSQQLLQSSIFSSPPPANSRSPMKTRASALNEDSESMSILSPKKKSRASLGDREFKPLLHTRDRTSLKGVWEPMPKSSKK